MKRVFHISGGRTSAYMTIKYYRPGDIVIFCDTGKEHPGTHQFLRDIEKNEGIPIVRLQYPGGWKELIRKRGTVPNQFKRKCTQELKVKTARRYLRSIGLFKYIQFIGFRADEKTRVDGYQQYWQLVTTEFPLYSDGTIKADVLEYWKTKSYDLQIPEILGNCDLCFLKGLNVIIAILTNSPELADKWIEEEESDPKKHTFHKGITMRQIKKLALQSKRKYSLEELTPEFSCSCSV